MRIPRVYTDQPLTENSEVTLDEAAAHYVATVLRMKTGRAITLFNGKGGEYQGRLQTIGKKAVTIQVEVFNLTSVESPLTIELGICLIKNDRMDWLLQKATELGVSSIVPLLSEYTDVKLPADRQHKKLQHWQQVVINACQQSGRTAVPQVRPSQRLSDWVEQTPADRKWVLHPGAPAVLLPDASAAPASIALLIGPEGGLAASEVELAAAHGFSPWSLGPRILRAETAPLTALAILQHQFGDLA